jgi:hypothetical protein
MATMRTRSDAEQRTSRQAATIAREMELLAGRRERLRERQDDLRTQLRELDDELAALNQRKRDLDRLLGHPAAAPDRAAPRLLGGATLRRHAVAHLLATGQHHDIHYRAWYEQLAANGLLVRGADPAATLLTNITRSPLITRGRQPGTYRLDVHAARRVDTLLAKARRRLQAGELAAAQRTERLGALVNRLERVQREIAECERMAAEQARTRAEEDEPRQSRRGQTRANRRGQAQGAVKPNARFRRAPSP